jgi:hypothetical protein
VIYSAALMVDCVHARVGVGVYFEMSQSRRLALTIPYMTTVVPLPGWVVSWLLRSFQLGSWCVLGTINGRLIDFCAFGLISSNPTPLTCHRMQPPSRVQSMSDFEKDLSDGGCWISLRIKPTEQALTTGMQVLLD